jgi:hypothetical protein
VGRGRVCLSTAYWRVWSMEKERREGDMIPIFKIQSINIHPVSKRNITSFVVGKQRAPDSQ